MKVSNRFAAGVSVLAFVVGGSGAWAATQASTTPQAAPTTTTSTTPTTSKTPTSTTTIGKVTKVSTTGHYFVINGRLYYVTKTTAYHLIRGGLVGIKTSRRYRVKATAANGKYLVLSVTRV